MAATDSRYELLELDLRGEELISLAQVCRLPALKGSVGPTAVYRWATPGIHGVRLPVLRVGRALHTTESAVNQFLERITNADGSERRTAAQARRAFEDAEAFADAEGF